MKINIENYENMTLEEKVAALEAYEPDMSGFVSKATFDKKASEAAELSKQLKSRMSEEEAQKAKDAEDRAALVARVEELEREKKVSGYMSSYLAMGYDEKLAKSSAEALANGDMDVVFKNQKTFAENREKTLRAELLKQTPPPPAGGKEAGMSKVDFDKMNLIEKQQFARENPELYASFFKKEE